MTPKTGSGDKKGTDKPLRNTMEMSIGFSTCFGQKKIEHTRWKRKDKQDDQQRLHEVNRTSMVPRKEWGMLAGKLNVYDMSKTDAREQKRKAA